MRGTNGTSAKNDLVACHHKGFAAALDLDSSGACAVKQEPMYQTVGLNGQVQPMPGLTQMTDGGAVANPFGVIERGRADAGRFWVVVVSTIGETGSTTRLIESNLAREPGVTRKPVSDDGAIIAMEFIGEILVIFQLTKVGEEFLEAPLIVTHGGPGVIILRDPTQEDLAIDGAGTTRHLAAWHQHLRGLVCCLADKLPVVVTGHDIDFGGIAVLHLFWQVLDIGIIRACLQQQDRARRILRQARRQNCPG
jgi:hypothetical protein